MMKKGYATALITILILCMITSKNSSSQNITQTIKGTVKDMDSQVPLIGASIVIMETSPVIGSISDSEGNFRIANIGVGRYNLKISYVGYDPVIIPEILVQSGKEVILQIQLKEAATTVSEVRVTANSSNKEQAINPMAMISSRQLNMEEASRYAGGIDDPSRLATAFAGVAGSLSSNAIVIRGNAPKGLLWRMEGVEIPNPSHFANVSTFGGGGITALSSQMLSNSDFFTGAFPAEYGNALSGVFDMRIRNGNPEKREHTFKVGLTGIDFATEGPFIKGKKSSYLMNYRYSTLALISPLLPANAQGLKYQDLSFKMNFPTGKHGTISTWGLFSADRTGSEVQNDSTEWKYYQDIEEDLNKNRMGALGLNYKVILSEKTYMQSLAAVTGNYIFWHRERLNDDMQLIPQEQISQNDRKYTFSVMLNHKSGPRHTNRTGLVVNRMAYAVLLKQNTGTEDDLAILANQHGASEFIQLYTQSRFDLPNNISINAGLHASYFTLNDDFSLEPRASVKWTINNNHAVTVAYGLHSRMEPIGFYFASQTTSEGEIQPNRNLKLAKAHHLVMAYEWKITDYSRIRLEPFYQQLYHVPVIPGSSFSMLNLEMDWFFNDSLINSGMGRNVGIDFTWERFLHQGYYYLITGSFFDSRYKGGDGEWRNSRFNKNYVVNFLFGKEWKMGKKDNQALSINWKFSLLGGDRITPVDINASASSSDVLYDESRAFSERKPNIYYLDFTASWQKNKPGYSATWSLQFVNLLFQKEFFGHRYNFRTNQVEPYKETIVIPNISYKIDF
jgi:hypothetical protein